MCKKRFLILAKTFDKKGRLIASGTNLYRKSHPLQAKLASEVGFPEKKFLHAEVSAMLRSKDNQIHRITVERFTSDGEFALAKPCKVCQKAISLYGIKIVEYTTQNGWVKEII